MEVLSMTGAKILIVDDENTVNHQIKSHIQKEGFLAFSAYTGSEALKIIKEKEPDLVLLDNMLPDMSGIETCLEIRKTNNVPIMFLSHRSEETDKIVALSVGGDDYLTKPFLPGELTARIKAHLRRRDMEHYEPHVSEEKIFEFPGLTINVQTREVYLNGLSVYLTAKEFDILAFLIEQPKQIYSPEEIYEHVWKANAIGNDGRTVMVYISILRKKIECNPDNPKYIINIRRVGYKFNHHLLF
jgi:DNA-binding response OmpR family regulator